MKCTDFQCFPSFQIFTTLCLKWLKKSRIICVHLIYTNLLSCYYENKKAKGEAQLSHLMRWSFKDTPEDDTWFHLINNALRLVGFSNKIFKAQRCSGLKHANTHTQQKYGPTHKTDQLMQIRSTSVHSSTQYHKCLQTLV